MDPLWYLWILTSFFTTVHSQIAPYIANSGNIESNFLSNKFTNYRRNLESNTPLCCSSFYASLEELPGEVYEESNKLQCEFIYFLFCTQQ